MKSKIMKFVKNPYAFFSPLFYSGHLKWIPDSLALRLWYKSIFGKKLNLATPKTLNEKLQWLKLFDRNSIYPVIVDKYSAKEYVSCIIGKEYIIKTIGVYETFDEINFDSLPSKFVIKCTHDSGGVVICPDKRNLEINQARIKIEKSLAHNYFYDGREWPYKMIKPRIIIEEYVSNDDGSPLKDYKLFCFDGHVKFLYVSENSHTKKQKLQFYDSSFEPIDCRRRDYNAYETPPSKPQNYDLMVSIAEKLSKGLPHVRVDLYEINKKVLFGEMTLYTCSGFIPFEDDIWDEKLGSYLVLPKHKV